MVEIKPNAVVLEQSSYDQCDINSQRIVALRHFVSRLGDNRSLLTLGIDENDTIPAHAQSDNVRICVGKRPAAVVKRTAKRTRVARRQSSVACPLRTVTEDTCEEPPSLSGAQSKVRDCNWKCAHLSVPTLVLWSCNCIHKQILHGNA